MSKIEEFFKTDKEWLEAYEKSRHIKSDRILTRTEFIKAVGWKKYSPAVYNEYVEAMKKKEKPSKFEF